MKRLALSVRTKWVAECNAAGPTVQFLLKKSDATGPDLVDGYDWVRHDADRCRTAAYRLGRGCSA